MSAIGHTGGFIGSVAQELLIEESELAAAAVAFLERAGVPEIDWRDRESARAGAPGKKS